QCGNSCYCYRRRPNVGGHLRHHLSHHPRLTGGRIHRARLGLDLRLYRSMDTGIIAAATALVGMSASLILTGSTMRRQSIPRAPILIATVSAVIGVFIIPFIGLFI